MNQPNPMNMNEGNAPLNASSEDQEPQALSLLGGVANAGAEQQGQGDPFGPDAEASSSKRGISQGTLLLVMVALIAGGSLYGMRMVSQAGAHSDVDQKVEAKMEKFLAKVRNPEAMEQGNPLNAQSRQALFADTDWVVEMLSVDYTEQQVPVQFIQKNPFAMDEPKPTELAKPVNDTSERDALLKQLQAESRKLELQTIMKSGTPVAVIDGEFYRQGQQVGSFTVSSIDTEALSVKLTSEGETFTLTMQE